MPLTSLKRALRRVIGSPLASPTEVRRKAAARIATGLGTVPGGNPVVYLDVGAAGARHPDWQWLLKNDLIRVLAVDMVDEWSRTSAPVTTGITRIKAALGDENAVRVVYLTRHPACSSCLKPNEEFLKRYPVADWFHVVREEMVTTRRFDQIAEEMKLPAPEIAKLDVQGFESQVLRGMGRLLDSVLCLEFECQLEQLYCGQETFFDQYRLLTGRGFVLRKLEAQGPFEGEAVEFNSFWARRPSNARERQIIALWEGVNEVPGAVDFKSLDEHQRHVYHFNA